MADPKQDAYMVNLFKFDPAKFGAVSTAAPPAEDGQAIRARAAAAAKDAKAIARLVPELDRMDMARLLELMDGLVKDGATDDFRENMPQDAARVGAALLTALQEYGEPWQAAVAKLTKAERAVVLKRAPADMYRGPKEAKEEDDPDQPHVVQASPDGVVTAATVTILEGITKNKIGEIAVEVHVGAGGVLSSIETDMTLFEKKLKGRLKNIPFQVTLAVSLSNEVAFNTDRFSRTTVDTIKVNVKSSLELTVKNVTVGVEAVGGSDRPAIGPTLKIAW